MGTGSSKDQIRARIKAAEESDLWDIVAELTSASEGNEPMRVCVYTRVGINDPAQPTTYELLRLQYEEMIRSRPGWIFAGMYVDEGVDDGSVRGRTDLNRMIVDCHAGMIDVILARRISRFVPNYSDCRRVIRELAELDPPVGVVFEAEGLFSLDSKCAKLLELMEKEEQQSIHKAKRGGRR